MKINPTEVKVIHAVWMKINPTVIKVTHTVWMKINPSGKSNPCCIDENKSHSGNSKPCCMDENKSENVVKVIHAVQNEHRPCRHEDNIPCTYRYTEDIMEENNPRGTAENHPCH